MLRSSLLNITKILFLIMLSFSVFILNSFAETTSSISDKLKTIESGTEGRLGIFAINTENGHVIKYRAEEVFPTQCTSKTVGVAAVLKKSMSDPSLLSQRIMYSKKDLDLAKWNPITEKYVSEGMTVKELCSAAISFSDNAAMNLLLKTIGGIHGMNDFARSIGDSSFRQDNDWPAEAYSGGGGNVKDSSTPQAMVEILHKVTIGEALDRPQRDLLTTWLINTETGAARITSGLPKGWIIGHKTGTGAIYGSTNDLAIVWPQKHKPILIGIYYTSNNPKAAKREDVLSASTKSLIEEFTLKDNSLKSLL